MSGHTKGPWKVHSHHKPISDQWIFTVITDEEYGSVICGTCTAPQWLDEDSRQANAHLIAAAPDLLEALALCLVQLEKEHMPSDEVMRAMHHARAAICKAVPTPRGEE